MRARQKIISLSLDLDGSRIEDLTSVTLDLRESEAEDSRELEPLQTLTSLSLDLTYTRVRGLKELGQLNRLRRSRSS